MKKSIDYEKARDIILNKRNNPNSRRRRNEIRNRDEKKIRRYGECPVKFSDFILEKKS